MDQNLPLTPVNVKTSSEATSPGRTLKKVALLTFFTLGLYAFRWFYLNWRDFRGKAWPEDISPLMRSLCIFIPFVGLFLAYKQFSRIQNYAAREVDLLPLVSPGWLAFCWYLQIPVSRAGNKFENMSFLLIVVGVMLSTFVLTRFQRLLNAYWLQTAPDLPLQDTFSTGEKIFVTLGSFWWIFILLGSLLPE